jgi:parallel beta-helix repeat protein
MKELRVFFLQRKVLALTFAMLAGALLKAEAASARDYYVSLTGNNSNPGTISQPLASIQKAVDQLKPGDIVSVRGGTYYLNSNVWIGSEHSGTSTARVVIGAYPGEKAILDGSRMTSGHCISTNAQYIDIKGFECRYSKQNGIVVWGGSNVKIMSNTVYDVPNTGIWVGSATNQINGSTNVLVQNNTVYRSSLINQARTMQGGWGMGIQAMRASSVTFEGNRVYNNYGEGIGCVLATKCVARSNTLNDNYSVEMYMDNATYSTFEKNLIYNTGNKAFYRQAGSNWRPAVGIQMANEDYGSSSNPLTDNTVRNNIVIGTHAGFWYGNYGKGGGLKNVKVVNNTFYKSDWALLVIDSSSQHSNSTFANNIFYQVNAWPMTYLSSQPGLFFQNNLWFGGMPGAAAGSNDVYSNPMLVNPGSFSADDYRLKVGSPAIDKGVTSIAPSNDYFGSARYQGYSSEIGADEY